MIHQPFVNPQPFPHTINGKTLISAQVSHYMDSVYNVHIPSPYLGGAQWMLDIIEALISQTCYITVN